MPPKRLHEQCDNDTGEGALNIKKIRIVRGENDSDEGIKKISIVRGGDDDDEGIMCEDCSQILYSAASPQGNGTRKRNWTVLESCT